LPLQVLLTVLVRWIAGEQQEVIEYLKAENRQSKNLAQANRIGRTPRDRARRGQAFEISDQQQPKVASQRSPGRPLSA